MDYQKSVTGAGTETVTFTTHANGTQIAVLSGSLTNNDKITLTISDAGLSGSPGQTSISHTVTTGDTLTSIVANLASQINNPSSGLPQIGISATSSAGVLYVNSISINNTSYSQAVTDTSSTPTETFTVGPSTNSLGANYNSLNQLTRIVPGGPTRIQGNSNKALQSASVTTSAINVAVPRLTYFNSIAPGASGLTISQTSSVNSEVFTFGGLVASGDIVIINISGSRIPGGGQSFSIQPPAESLSALAAAFATAINAAIGSQVTASATGAVLTIVDSPTYAVSTTPSTVTESVSVGANDHGNAVVTVSGTCTSGDVLKITSSFSSTSASYTVGSSDSLTNIATQLASALNAITQLQAISLTASTTTAATLNSSQNFTANPVLGLGQNSVNVTATDGGSNNVTNNYQVPNPGTGTVYTASTSAGATETISLGVNHNGNISATIGGTAHTGDTLAITANGPLFSQAGNSVSYTVQSGDTLTNVVSGLTSALNTALVPFQMGASSSSMVISITGNNAMQPFTFDLNGNLLNDGTNAYQYDYENRLILVNYPNTPGTGTLHSSAFTYDGFGHLVQIVETVGTSTTTKIVCWVSSTMAEIRDASGNLVNQYFTLGQVNFSGDSGTNYLYTRDHLRSVREMTDSYGNIQAEYQYDPYGRMTKLQGSLVSEFQYAGYYMHAPSSLNLTVHRAYDSAFGRWINRDPIEELGGIDLYAYVHNEPVDHQDPSGLFQWYGNWGGPNWVNGGPGSELGPFPWNPSQRGFHKPWDPRDRCYYWHDICLHNAGISKNKTQRRCDRRNCDVALSQCLQYVKDTYPNQFGGITPGEIGNFGSPGSFNDNPGEDPNPNNPQKPYPVNYDPGVINPGVPKQ